MTDTGTSGWQGPPPQPGPAPGVEFASYGARIVGYIIDSIIVTIITIILVVIGLGILTATSSFTFDETGTVTSGTVSTGGLTAVLTTTLLALIFAFLYFPWFWARGGQTPGMRMTGIRVVSDADGARIGWGKAFLRLIGWWISSIVIYIGFIWVFIDGRRRGWFDLIAGTVVIKA
jgi:uncharacterized RDD family membrane protein YckC